MPADNESPLLISLLVGLESQEGHQYTYNQAVGAALRMIDWSHLAAVSRTCHIAPLPEGWTACLDRGAYRFQGNPLPKINSIFRLAKSMAAYLQAQAAQHSQPMIVFMEYFNYLQLISLTLALLRVPRQRLSVWLLYRVAIQRQRHAARLYALCHKVIKHLVGASHFVLLTDSEALSAALAQLFRQDVHVMPIPHLDVSISNAAPLPFLPALRPDTVLCWWPGPPRPAKGWAIVQRLAQQPGADARQLGLIAAAGAQLQAGPAGCQIVSIGNELTRAEYLGWLHRADLILLPYQATAYAEQTSGIFAEAIAAGKPALVTAHTWMAHELIKYDLAELIVDWDSATLPAYLLRIARDSTLRRKLEKMQAAYLAQHNEANYASRMRALYVESQIGSSGSR